MEIHCQSCGATLTLAPELRTAHCPYCDSAAVVERPPTEDRPSPSFVLAFDVPREQAVASVKRFLRTRGIFAHGGLKTAALEKVRGVYLPAYLYGAIADSDYSCRIGEDYTETETYTVTVNGKTQTRTRTVTKTEWRDLSGEHSAYLLDILVSASQGIPNDELEAIEPFDLRALRRYTGKALAGWIAEEPSRSKDECFELAHGEGVARIGRELDAFMPGDSHRDLRHQTSLRDEVIDLALLPVWVFAARYDEAKPPIRVLVNGQTGEAQGDAPLSATKITIAVVIAVIVIGALVLLFMSAGGRR